MAARSSAVNRSALVPVAVAFVADFFRAAVLPVGFFAALPVDVFDCFIGLIESPGAEQSGATTGQVECRAIDARSAAVRA
jgi:hypothetical protein